MLVVLLFGKNVYGAGLGSYHTFCLIKTFDLPVQHAQMLLFLDLGAVVLGTLAGGMVGDRVGRIPVIWFSILGALPFTLALPHAGLFWTAAFSVLIGSIMASAFSAILVYAQELLPGRVGLVAGIFFGFSFGLGGPGAAAPGQLADRTSIRTVYPICAFLPLPGLATAFLPKLGRPAEGWNSHSSPHPGRRGGGCGASAPNQLSLRTRCPPVLCGRTTGPARRRQSASPRSCLPDRRTEDRRARRAAR